MRSDRLRGYMDSVILSVLSDGDSYGYDIVQQVNHRTDGSLVLKEGSLYPALKRLEANRFVQGYWGTETENGPRRRYYSITEWGRAHLARQREEWKRDQLILSRFFGKVMYE